jgi:hypothetical protein
MNVGKPSKNVGASTKKFRKVGKWTRVRKGGMVGGGEGGGSSLYHNMREIA